MKNAASAPEIEARSVTYILMFKRFGIYVLHAF